MPNLSSLPRSRARRLDLVFALAGTALVVAGATRARADTVFLRDGRIVRGDVRERTDGKIEIIHRHGALIVDRNEVARVDSDTNGGGSANPWVDTVVTTDGRVLTGNVTIAEDTKEVVVTNEKFGGETRIAHDLIRGITFRKGKQSPVAAPGASPGSTDGSTEEKWRAQIDASLTKLRDPLSDANDRKAARRQLLALGIYATQYIKDTIAQVASNDQVVLPVLSDVLRVAQLKTVVSASIEEKIPDICERLIDPDPALRVKAVEDVAVFFGDDAPPLLLHLIRHDPSPKVKAMCVGELSMLKRYDDLGAVLKMREHGQLRFVAALELGEAGIYAGIPVILEALRLDGPAFKDVRVTAIEALKKFTGQGDLGYLPESEDKTSRDEAVKRWESWWEASGANLVSKSLRSFDKQDISDADRGKALDRWREGNKALDEIEKKDQEADAKKEKVDAKVRSYSYELAAHLFKEATDLDPTLCAARLSRALVLYEQLGRSREAENELKLVLSRFTPEDATYPRVLATYHLGRIAELDGEWRKAQLRYEDAAHLDESFFDAFIGVGDCSLEQALAVGPGGSTPIANDESSKPALDPAAPFGPKQTREEYLTRAVASYRRAIDAINKKSEALKNTARDLGGVTGETESFREGRLLTTIRTDRDDLTKRAANVWFRIGRAQSARGDAKEAVMAFKLARELDGSNAQYKDACTFWEDALHEGGK
jgi:tetratricopeptide (TPR) repeat protein